MTAHNGSKGGADIPVPKLAVRIVRLVVRGERDLVGVVAEERPDDGEQTGVRWSWAEAQADPGEGAQRRLGPKSQNEDMGVGTGEVSGQCSPVGLGRSTERKHAAVSRGELGASCPAVRGLRTRGLEGPLSRTEIPSGVVPW